MRPDVSILVPIALYGCETLCATIVAVNSFSVFEKRVLRKTRTPISAKVAELLTKLQSNKFHTVFVCGTIRAA
jgi:hypothetical protein